MVLRGFLAFLLVVLAFGGGTEGADVPACDSCMCWFIMDDDSIDSANNMPDVTWWAEKKFKSFFSSKGICDGGSKALECILNDGGDVGGNSLCKDVSAGGSGNINNPDGGSCVSPPYDVDYYAPFWMWNRATDSPGLCGSGVTARFPSGRGAPNSSPDTGIWRVLPTVASDGYQVVGYLDDPDSCKLPGTVPDSYTVHQMVSGTRKPVSKSGGNSVKWDEVTYDEWVGAYLMGLIAKDCLSRKIQNFNPMSDIEVHDLKGRTCLAMVYDSDVNAGNDLDLGDHGELYTSDLGNERLGVFKFTIVDHEVPGAGVNLCGGVGDGPDVGKGCGPLNTNNVGEGDQEMYLLWWLQPECAEGNDGYVWQDDVAQITQDCNPATCAASLPSIGQDQLSWDSKACTDYIAVWLQWGGGGDNKRCDPYVRFWVDGGDEGNDLNVPFALDGYTVDCSEVCKPCFGPDKVSCSADDHLYETFGSGKCKVNIPFEDTSSINGNYMMASTCGGGSQGGWEKFYVGSTGNGIGVSCSSSIPVGPPSPSYAPSQCPTPTPGPGYVECTCEDGEDDSACIPGGHLVELLDFDADAGYADYAVCSVYPGGGGDGDEISHFDFMYDPDPPCASGSWSLTGCKNAYDYSDIGNPAVTSFDSCGSTQSCPAATQDTDCSDIDLTDVDLLKCDYSVKEGKCVTARLQFPSGMKLGSLGSVINDGSTCAQGCSLGPSCVKCTPPPPPPPTPDLEDPCAEFNNGLLPYCYGLDDRSANKECGEPYDVSRTIRNEHHHDAFHTKNSRELRETPSYNSIEFSQKQFQSMDYFNPSYEKGRFQNGLGKKLSIPLTNGAARVDCPETTTNIRIRLDGLSAGQEIWLAGDSGSEGNWHGRLQGPYRSDQLIKAKGYTASVPGAGLVVVVEGAGAENVVVSGAVCLFNYGDRTRKVHKIPQQVVANPPNSRVVEDVLLSPQTRDEEKEGTGESKDAHEEVLTGVADGWSNLEGFASGSGDGFAGAKRGYTPSSDCFCQEGLFDYPCTEFCEETLPCTVNMECMKDNQLVFPRQVPEQAVGLITFMTEDEDTGDIVPFICSGGLIGQVLGHPPGKDCSDNYVDYCPDGYYNNFDSTRFLTAGHCLSDQDTADTVEFLFNYSISCEQGVTGNCYSSNPPTVEEHPPLSYNYDCAYTTTGADLLISSQDPQFAFIQESADLWLPYGDFTILSLTGSLPPQRCYFGYSTINHANAFGEVLHRVGHPMGAPRAYAQSQVSDSSVWAGGPMENNPANIEGDYIASLQLNLTNIGMSALGPQGGASGGIVFNDYAQAVGTQTGWTFFWGWIEQDGSNNLDGIHGELIFGLDMDACNPNYFGPEFVDGGKTYRVVNQYVVIDGSFYAYFNSVEDELQDLCCPPFLPHDDVVGTTKLDFSINPDGSSVDPPGGQYSGWVGSGVYTRWIDWGVLIYTQKPGQGATWQSLHPPQLFNSSHPCCGDDDLGAPNEVFNGPGEGEGGESGPGANMRRHGWVMIISENNNQEKPDDEVGGGAIVFEFTNPVPIAFVEIIDIDFDEIDGFIEATNTDGHVTTLPIIAYGDNAYYRADFYVTEIVNLTVFFPGSGSVAGLTFCDVNSPLQNTLGDRVWFDQNANGIQEVYENIGVEGVVVQLHAADRGTGSDQRLAQTVTDENGWYQFTSLADGEYVVSFTVDDNLPFFDPYKGPEYEGWGWSPPNEGSDTSLDSNAVEGLSGSDNRAITSVIPLSGGVKDLTWDAGITINSDNVCIPRSTRREEPVVKRKKVSAPKEMKASPTRRMSYKPKKSNQPTKARK